MTTYMFPGQGSQIRGMGKELFSDFPDLVEKANHILGYSIQQLCLENVDENLNQTNYTQPAMYVVNALSYLKRMKELGQKPNFVMGHSLGEYNALFAAEVFDFETGLKLVKARGELMAKAKGGAMAAVLGIKKEDIKDILEKNELLDINIANYNSHTQIVISGPRNDIIAAKRLFEDSGATFILLKVSGAFHSYYMDTAKQHFSELLNSFDFKKPTISVIANVNAQPYDLNQVRSQLLDQITNPVQWTRSIEYLLAHGEMEFAEVGPGAVLTGLLTRIKSGH